MADRSVLAARLQVALEQTRDILQKHDEESAGRLGKASADGRPDPAGSVPPLKKEDMVLCFLAESVATLASIVDRELQTKRRGRPKGS